MLVDEGELLGQGDALDLDGGLHVFYGSNKATGKANSQEPCPTSDSLKKSVSVIACSLCPFHA
jgi:hypothetical protein